MKSIILLCFLLKISIVLSEPGIISVIRNLFVESPKNVTFRLYTRASPTNYISLQTGRLSDVALDLSKLFIFLIHGYRDKAEQKWVIDMKNAYLTKGDYNVIAVDWSEPAAQLYPKSAANTKDVGKSVALFIIDKSVPYENVHLVGHSLGAHAAGFCGQYLLRNVGRIPARITGLDPAGPLFWLVNHDSRLSREDAAFVDVIHTDGNILGFGYIGACGHIDFYPNGGTPPQPGCITGILNIDLYDLASTVSCSHSRVLFYFIESINSVGFISHKCNSYPIYLLGLCNNNQVAVMGENVDQRLRGEFYLRTNAHPPYAKN